MSAKTVDTNLDEGVLNNSEWVQRWAVGNTAFHQPKYDPFLEKREDEMFGGKAKSLFLPLCGKTPDMMWMYEHGHTVCGVEIAEQAIKELFEENKIEVDIQDIPDVGKLYKSKDGRLSVYVADLFDMSAKLCGTFDIIWDSRSFVAINLCDHEIYRDLLLSLMKKDGLYVLSTIDYDPAVWPGPPHNIPDKLVRDVFGEVCNIELLEEEERTGKPLNAPRGSSVEETTQDSPPKPSSAGAAIKTSSYVFDRWYKMTQKS